MTKTYHPHEVVLTLRGVEIKAQSLDTKCPRVYACESGDKKLKGKESK